MKRFLLSVCAVLIFAIAPASAIQDESPKAQYKTMMKAFDAGDHDAVVGIVRKLDTSALSESQQAYVLLVEAKVALADGDYQTALANFDGYMNYNGKPAFSDTAKSWGWRGRAECHLGLGDYDKGLAAIAPALTLEFADRSRWIKARLLFNSGAYDEAQSWLEKFLLVDKRAAGKSGYHNLLGLTYIHLDDYDSAIDVLRPASKMKGAKAYVHNNLGSALLRRDAISYASAGGGAMLADLKEGVAVLTKAVELGSGTAVGSLANAKAALAKRDN